MMCITMRMLAGASYLDLSWPYGISKSAVYDVFHEILLILDEVLPPIVFPQSPEECVREADKFCNSRNTPFYGAICALDGCAVEIREPSVTEVSDPRKYRNRKGFFALVLQAAVTSEYRFVFISATHAGGTHDSTAFQASKLHQLISSGKLPSWALILADDAYQNELNVITPYSGENCQ